MCVGSAGSVGKILNHLAMNTTDDRAESYLTK
jgi:hypothetical protein